MSETYTGWDGKSYPWPPPDGWYEAPDGRWWAPGTGPKPPEAQGAADVPASTPPPQSPPQQQGVAEDVGRTAQLPADVGHGGAGAAGLDAPAEATVVSQGAPAATPPPTLAGDTGPSGDDWGSQTSQWDQPPDATPPTADDDRSTLAKAGLVLAGVAAALIVAAGAYFVLRDDGTDTAADGGDTSTDGATTSTEGGEDQSTSASSTDDTDSSDDPTTSATEDSTTSTSTSSSTTADTSTQVNEFRQILADNSLTSEGLSDEDIATFGTRFCVFATASESESEYEEFRRQAIETTSSDLSDDELFTVVDAAVAVFCPDEAARLGIEL